MTSIPRLLPRAAAAVAATVAIAAGIAAAGAGAAPTPASYAVESIVLTYASSVTTTAAVLPDGTGGTLTTTLAGTLRGKADADGPARLTVPEVANEYICEPSCPGFVARGAVRVTQVFTPAKGGTRKTCAATRTLKATGRVYFTSTAKGSKALDLRLQDATDANALYLAARGTCRLPTLPPFDSYDYSSFGDQVQPATILGAKTITVTLANALRPPTYPWAATGKTSVTAKAVVVRKG